MKTTKLFLLLGIALLYRFRNLPDTNSDEDAVAYAAQMLKLCAKFVNNVPDEYAAK